MIKDMVVKFLYGIEKLHDKLEKYGSKVFYRYKVRRYHLKNINKNSLSRKEKTLIKAYWGKYVKNFDMAYHQYYVGATGNFDVRFIPDDLHINDIDAHFNNRKMHTGVCDKNYFDLWFEGMKRPRTICHKINGLFYNERYELITKEDAVALLLDAKSFIKKPCLSSSGGQGVEFVDAVNEKIVRKIINSSSSDDIYQEIIEQHESLNKIHKESVNSLRIMTLLFDNKVYHVSSILRMGVGNSRVDNALAGGIYVGINSDGSLKDVAHDIFGKRYDKHPSGFEFNNFVIPGYEKAVQVVLHEAEKMAHFRLISWDIAIDKNAEPVLIEANLQAGGIGVLQVANGPLFGELTEAVLKEVYKK